MYKPCIAVAVLMLALVGLNNQCQGLFGPNPLAQLNDWLDKQPNKPDTNEGYIEFIKRLELSKFMTGIKDKKEDYKKLKHPKVKELINAIRELNLNDFCSRENLIATKEVKRLILNSYANAFDPRTIANSHPLVKAINDYLLRVKKCYQTIITRVAGENWDNTALEFFDSVNNAISIPINRLTVLEGYSGRPFEGAMRRKRLLDEGKGKPFSAKEMIRMVYALHGANLRSNSVDIFSDNRTILKKSDVLKYIREGMITPCKRLVKERGALLEPIILLGSFENLHELSPGGSDPLHILASRHLSCVMLIGQEDKLDDLAEAAAKAQEK